MAPNAEVSTINFRTSFLVVLLVSLQSPSIMLQWPQYPSSDFDRYSPLSDTCVGHHNLPLGSEWSVQLLNVFPLNMKGNWQFWVDNVAFSSTLHSKGLTRICFDWIHSPSVWFQYFQVVTSCGSAESFLEETIPQLTPTRFCIRPIHQY